MLTGSSQLTRGTLGGSDIRAGLCRFIPACAGNSYERKKVTEYTSVHPRLRGELGPHIGSRIGFIGSSPLTRGTPPEKFYDGVRSRFIPAYAGNSPMSFTRQCAVPVHPRLRGELATDTVSVTGGSSPLTRGTQQETFGARQRPRFIPAYAGNSRIALENVALPAVHPRLRGELRYFRGPDLSAGRFIPAYAGNSLKQGIEHLTNSSKDFLSGKYAKNPETVLNHFKNSSLD